MNEPTDEERKVLAIRFICDQAARGFHIELIDALLEGGGHISGRIHRDAELPAAGLTVEVRCLEAWRDAPPASIVVASTRARPPRWHQTELWSTKLALEGLHAAHWLPFAAEIPDGLPPAIEARSIAWRYEIHARRSRRLLPAEHAIATPLRYRQLTVDRELSLPRRLA